MRMNMNRMRFQNKQKNARREYSWELNVKIALKPFCEVEIHVYTPRTSHTEMTSHHIITVSFEIDKF